MKILVALLLVTSAQAASWDDPADADAPYDVREVAWQLYDDTIELSWRLSAAPDTEASYTATVFVGRLNESEPHEIYIVQYGPGGQWLLEAHGEEPRRAPLYIDWNGSAASAEVPRSGQRGGDCAFAVMQTSLDAGGRDVQDQVPDDTPDPTAAWKAGAPCLEAQVQRIVEDLLEDNGIPMVSPFWLLVALVFVRR